MAPETDAWAAPARPAANAIVIAMRDADTVSRLPDRAERQVPDQSP
jgi:hypothetical protein